MKTMCANNLVLDKNRVNMQEIMLRIAQDQEMALHLIHRLYYLEMLYFTSSYTDNLNADCIVEAAIKNAALQSTGFQNLDEIGNSIIHYILSVFEAGNDGSYLVAGRIISHDRHLSHLLYHTASAARRAQDAKDMLNTFYDN